MQVIDNVNLKTELIVVWMFKTKATVAVLDFLQWRLVGTFKCCYFLTFPFPAVSDDPKCDIY